MENVKSKVIIITGASSGIGEATAKLLAKNGARVILAARREERLKDIVSEIGQNGGHSVYFQADVSSYEDMQKLAQ
jgi:NADP-dependent 3-hydroxy acid dehydrogenase YdfG